VRIALERLLGDHEEDDAVVWAHNLGIARNLILTRELAAACARRGLRLIAHHHDWWFDNRWLRWPEMQRSGFRTLRDAASVIFPTHRNLVHAAINRADVSVLRRHFGNDAGWLPNLTERGNPPRPDAVKRARKWLARTVGGEERPVWIVPCRSLRRKNLAEALLLTRWLRPDACLVTTGGASSADEQAYFERFQSAATRHGWPLRLGVLAGGESGKPTVAELIAASEAVLLTSVQEGFGLPYLEAAAAGRPLLARRLPNVAPDLETFGFKFPQNYDEVLVAPELFDWKQECLRQRRLFRSWKTGLPAAARKFAGVPVVLALGKPQPVPFSRLTLTAQFEIIAQPVAMSWERCAPLNPWLKTWRQRISRGDLKPTAWPRNADQWLGGVAYAKQFGRIARMRRRRMSGERTGATVQEDFIRERLDAGNLFPLLWSRES
jgi:glycosyltransferase involved in cell wall biosynthesis